MSDPKWLSGVFNVPTATAIPPGTKGRQRLPTAAVLVIVAIAKSIPAPKAHSFAIGGSPWPVTSLAVKIHTYAVGT